MATDEKADETKSKGSFVLMKIERWRRRHKQSVEAQTKRKIVLFLEPSIGGGGTPIYWLYGYVSLERVWFSSILVWYRV